MDHSRFLALFDRRRWPILNTSREQCVLRMLPFTAGIPHWSQATSRAPRSTFYSHEQKGAVAGMSSPFAKSSKSKTVCRFYLRASGHDAIEVAGTKVAAGVCLKKQPVYCLLPPQAFQASLQTSIFQARNRTTGADMSPLQQKKRRKEPRTSPLSSRKFISSNPKANRMQGALPAPNRTQLEANPLGFAQDFVAERSSSDVTVAPTDPQVAAICPPNLRPPSLSKSAQA